MVHRQSGQGLLAVTLLAVLGSPISHSRSPQIHSAAYEALGLDWRYTRVRCGEAALAPFLRGRGEEWRGFSLTMPLKEEAFRLASEVDPIARESGVVNTLLRRAHGGWSGFNTDVAGLAAAIRNAGHDATRTVILGSGATAISAILAARSLGAARIDLVARNTAAVTTLVDRFNGTAGPTGVRVEVRGAGPERLGEVVAGASGGVQPTLIISTLPGAAAASTPIPDAATRVPLFDVAYDPWPSPLAARWREAGTVASPGTAMLVEQAFIQIRIFVGGDPAVALPAEAAARAAVDRVMAGAA